jgi:hypothetical protein
MKRRAFILLTVVFYTLSYNNAAGSGFSTVKTVADSIPKEEQREKAKQDLKDSHQRLMIKASYVYASLNTSLTFDLVNSIFSANISLESDFKLPDSKLFFSGSLSYRFTPRSGLYASYYGISRSTTYTTDKDYIFLRDTIPKGVNGTSSFSTQVLSAGYLLTILDREHVFLGAYFNLYIINFSTGFKSESFNLDLELDQALPFPNFGLAALFPVNNWFNIHANVGFFNMSFENIGGSINNFELAFEFKPISWLGLYLSYQSFDLNLYDVADGIDFIIV